MTEAAIEHYLEKATRRITQLLKRLDTASRLLSWLRLAVFVLGLGLFVLLGETRQLSLALGGLGLSLGIFILLVKRHQRIRSQQRRCVRSLALRQNDRARRALDWEQIPPLPPSEPQAGHPFELDLDITGPHSLYRLVHHCLTAEGGARLKDWLLNQHPDLDRIQTRQRQVAALKGQLRFRDRLDLALCEVASQYRHQGQSKQTQDWQSREVLEHLQELPERRVQPFLLLLAGMAVITALFFGLAQIPLDGHLLWPNSIWKGSLSLYILLFWWRRDLITQLFKEAHDLQYTLYRLEALFEVLETLGPTRPPALRDLLAPFLDPERRPSQLIRRLNRVVGAAGVQGNPLLWVFLNLVMPWDFYFAWRLEALKPELKAALPLWLDRLWELEALISLAHYAWLHPQTQFPQLSSEQAGIQVKALGHPLLPQQRKIRNDFALQQRGEGFLITGSNMSGKSTFLKSLGINLVLAQAGGVVDAERFVAQPMRLFTCIRVSDSVTDGLSYFYAEVKRLRALLEAIEITTAEQPVFFLVDEIFKGTNNRERLIGSRAYIQALTGKNALGGISTHDLELVPLADHNPLLSNYHFREEIRNERMVFDYRLRSGPCPTTNALRIMALEGLPVGETEMQAAQDSTASRDSRA